MERLRQVLAVSGCLLGMAHIAFGIVSFPSVTLNVVWFLGAGIAMMTCAITNMGASQGNPWSRRSINILTTSYTLLILAYAPLPQVFLAVSLFGGLLLISFRKPHA